MKEFDEIDKALDGVEIRAEQEKKKEVKLIGKQRRIPGLTLWEFNKKTKDLEKAKFKKQDVILSTLDPTVVANSTTHHKVEINEGCFYFQALNKKNAQKKLKKLGFTL